MGVDPQDLAEKVASPRLRRPHGDLKDISERGILVELLAGEPDLPEHPLEVRDTGHCFSAPILRPPRETSPCDKDG